MILRCNWDMTILINSDKLEQLQIEVARLVRELPNTHFLQKLKCFIEKQTGNYYQLEETEENSFTI